MPEPETPVIADASQTQAELNAKIEAELGLPHTEVADEKTQVSNSDEQLVGEKDAKEGDDGSGDDVGGEGDSDNEDTNLGDDQQPVPAEPSNAESFIEVEDAEGVTHKISKLEDLPEDFQYKTSRQPLEILRKLDKLEADTAQAEATARTKAEEAEFTKTKQEQFDSWDREVTELSKQKRIDIKDTDRVDAVFKHMNEVNAARTKAGNPNTINSFEDALDKFEAFEAKNKASDEKQADNDRAKNKARLIGSRSAASGTESRPYVSGSYRSIDDVPL